MTGGRALARGAARLRVALLDAARRGGGAVAGLRGVVERGLGGRSDAAFADEAAQAIVCALFAARVTGGEGAGRVRIEDLPGRLPATSRLVQDLLAGMAALGADAAVRPALDDVAAAFEDTPAGDGAIRDPLIRFYEGFLAAYAPGVRRARGVYYTPDAVVSAVVRIADDVLRTRFGLPLGLADTTTWGAWCAGRGVPVPHEVDPDGPLVRILDPAAGTGTFLVRIVEVVHATMDREWARRGLDAAGRRAAWGRYVREGLLPRLGGVEIMAAPCLVAHLRLALLLRETGVELGPGDTLRIRAGDTLAGGARPFDDGPVTVVLGNPPYEREPAGAGHGGGWVRAARGGAPPPLEDYLAPARGAGAGGHLKNLYNLYVYFWRWATWAAFERHGGPGLVSFVSASSFVRGPGFVGLRAHARRVADAIHVLDLGGDGRDGSGDGNVFAIRTPVAITTMTRSGPPDPGRPAAVWHARLAGPRDDKLARCARIAGLAGLPWIRAPDAWGAPFVGRASPDVARWPALADLFPWRHSGVQYKRTWPIGVCPAQLEARWAALLRAPDRGVAFRETAAWRVDRRYPPLRPGDPPAPPLADLPAGAPPPPIVRYGFRSFDRRWAFADARLGDRLRPSLWRAAGPGQVFLTAPSAGGPGPGPAATASAHVPDLHHFCGRGGRDVVPLWRDPARRIPNIREAALRGLAAVHGAEPTAEDLFAFVYAVLAHPGYVARLGDALDGGGLRVPIPRDPRRFARGAALGRDLLHLHTFGERFGSGRRPAPGARCLAPVHGWPAGYRYEAATGTLHVGGGAFGPVSEGAWTFTVSGLPVVRSWLDARTGAGAGRRSSPLDDIRPAAWTPALTSELLELLGVLEATLARRAALDALLADLLESPVITVADLR